MSGDDRRIGDTGSNDHRDPEPSEIEIDAANDATGGPRTDSLSAGLSSMLRPEDAVSAGEPEDKEKKEQRRER